MSPTFLGGGNEVRVGDVAVHGRGADVELVGSGRAGVPAGDQADLGLGGVMASGPLITRAHLVRDRRSGLRRVGAMLKRTDDGERSAVSKSANISGILPSAVAGDT